MLEIRLLGRFEVKRDGVPLRLRLRSAKQLLAYLALNAGKQIMRPKLAEILWQDNDARGNLRGALLHLNKTLGQANPLRPERETIELDPTQACWIDAHQFITAKAPRFLSTPELIDLLELYEGELMPGFTQNWVAVERSDLENKFRQRMGVLLEKLEAIADWSTLIEWGQRFLTRVEVDSEKAYCALLRAYFHLHDLAQIEATYADCVRVLKAQKPPRRPAEETQRLYQELLAALQNAHLFQSKPPIPKPPEPPFIVPTFTTPFVGREQELAQIGHRLADRDCRLLTLTGLGGIGKSRLMTEALPSCKGRFAQGIFFVSLVAATSVEQMVTTLADTFKFNFYGKEPPRQQLIDYLREKEILLALDNLEQVEQAAEFLEALLGNARQIKVITTARERLHLPQEWIFDVPGLSYPARDDDPHLADYGAVKLCVQAVQRLANLTLTHDDLSLIARLTRLVGGMPLAIEMAAAWFRALPVAEITRQIEQNLSWLITSAPNVPERQHSLRAVFDYSWRLLNESEKRLFRRLAVFQGSFQRTAAEKITHEPLSLFISLMDKSLVRRVTGDRYELHALLRQFAEEKLYASNVDGERPIEVETKFAHYFLEYAGLYQHQYAQFELEWDNVHAAIRAAHRNQLWAVVLGLTETLSEAWLASNHLTEARPMYALAQEAALALNHQRGLARVQNHWGRACVEQNDYEEGKLHLTQALEISRSQKDLAGIAQTSYQLSYCAVEEAQWGEAELHLAECLQLYEQLGDQQGLADAIFQQARVYLHRDQSADAIQLATQALHLHTSLQHENGQIPVLRLLANYYVDQRFNEPHNEAALLEKAWEYCQQARELCEKTQNHDELALVLRSLASIAKLRGDLSEALKYVRSGLDLLQHKGNRRDQSIALIELSMIQAKAGEYTSALETAQQSLQLCKSLNYISGSIYGLTMLGECYLGLNQKAKACEIWQEALTAAKQFDSSHPQIGPLYQRLQKYGC